MSLSVTSNDHQLDFPAANALTPRRAILLWEPGSHDVPDVTVSCHSHLPVVGVMTCPLSSLILGGPAENVRKVTFFPPLRCKVVGEWGGSAH